MRSVRTVHAIDSHTEGMPTRVVVGGVGEIPGNTMAAKRRYFAANAIGGYPFIGTPDRIADELAAISRAGMRGIALSFVNYLLELPYFCDEVLPRLARLGVRSTRSP